MDSVIYNILAKQSEGYAKPGDYTNSEGVLICGKCGEPRTSIKEFPPGSGQKKAFPIICRCDEEEERQYKERLAEQKRKDRVKLLRRSGIYDTAYSDYTFANDDGRNPVLTKKCKKYVEHWEEMADLKCGIVLYGDVGGGKSFFAGCIVNALLDKGVPALITRLSYLVNNRIDKNTPSINLNQFSLIALDDIGAENASQTAFDIVNDIYLMKIPILLTTNLRLSEMKNPEGIERERIYNRLLERAGEKWVVPVVKSRIDSSRELDRKAKEILSK